MKTSLLNCGRHREGERERWKSSVGGMNKLLMSKDFLVYGSLDMSSMEKYTVEIAA